MTRRTAEQAILSDLGRADGRVEKATKRLEAVNVRVVSVLAEKSSATSVLDTATSERDRLRRALDAMGRQITVEDAIAEAPPIAEAADPTVEPTPIASKRTTA